MNLFFTLARIPADPNEVAPSYCRSVALSPRRDVAPSLRRQEQSSAGPRAPWARWGGAQRAPSGPFGPVWEGTVGLNADVFFERFGALGSASDNVFGQVLPDRPKEAYLRQNLPR